MFIIHHHPLPKRESQKGRDVEEGEQNSGYDLITEAITQQSYQPEAWPVVHAILTFLSLCITNLYVLSPRKS